MEVNPYSLTGKSRCLSDYNTFKVAAWAQEFVEYKTAHDLDQYFKVEHNGCDSIVLGGGSNILFTKNYDGSVLHSTNDRVEFHPEGNGQWVNVKAYAGVEWDEFVKICLKKGCVGLEALSLIPGSVGAAPVQNIGAYGAEVSEYIEEVECYDPSEKTTLYLKNEECDFSYRSSIFKRRTDLIVISVTFKLCTSAMLRHCSENNRKITYKMYAEFIFLLFLYSCKSVRVGKSTGWRLKMNFDYVRDIVGLPIVPSFLKRWIIVGIRKRNMPDPKKVANVGCFFKNPIVKKECLTTLSLPACVAVYGYSDTEVKVSAGDLIKLCQLNGYQKNGVRIDKDRPLIIISSGDIAGRIIYEFAMHVKSEVARITGVNIEPEVVIV